MEEQKIQSAKKLQIREVVMRGGETKEMTMTRLFWR
jgi:hypothetical protein